MFPRHPLLLSLSGGRTVKFKATMDTTHLKSVLSWALSRGRRENTLYTPASCGCLRLKPAEMLTGQTLATLWKNRPGSSVVKMQVKGNKRGSGKPKKEVLR